MNKMKIKSNVLNLRMLQLNYFFMTRKRLDVLKITYLYVGFDIKKNENQCTNLDGIRQIDFFAL